MEQIDKLTNTIEQGLDHLLDDDEDDYRVTLAAPNKIIVSVAKDPKRPWETELYLVEVKRIS